MIDLAVALRCKQWALVFVAVLTMFGAAAPALAQPANREAPIPPAPQLTTMHIDQYWRMAPRAGAFHSVAGLTIQAGDGNINYTVGPGQLVLDLNAQALAQAEPGLTSFVWSVDGTVMARTPIASFAVGRGVHDLALTVSGRPAAQPAGTFTQHIAISMRDRLIVSLGDSVAAGEGNPDIPSPARIGTGYQWQNKRCHRSGFSYGERASEALQFGNPKQAVTYLSFACSGAGTGDTAAVGIDCTPFLSSINPFPQVGSGPCRQAARETTSDPIMMEHGGILSGYEGEEFFTHPKPAPLAAQIVDLARAVGNTPIDDLVITVGGNDLNFGSITKDCASPATACNQAQAITSALGNALSELSKPTGGYDKVATAIAALNVRRVWITTYFDPTTGDNRSTCPNDTILRDVGDYGKGVFGDVSSAEASWVSRDLIGAMNAAIEAAAARNNWNVVGASTSAGGTFQTRFIGHGYCASDSWVVHGKDSSDAQGPDGPGNVGQNTVDTTGTLHPNSHGTQVYADALVERLTVPGPRMMLSTGIVFAGNCERGNGWVSGNLTLLSGNNNCSPNIGFTVDVRAAPSAPPAESGLMLAGAKPDQTGPLLVVDGNPQLFDRTNPLQWVCHSPVIDCVVNVPAANASGKFMSAMFFVTSKTEGRHSYSLTVANGIGTDSEVVWTANADWTPPTSHASLAPGITLRLGAKAVIVTSDAMSGVEQIFYTLNGGPTATYAGGVLMRENDVIEYWATDNAGNIEVHHRARRLGRFLVSI